MLVMLLLFQIQLIQFTHTHLYLNGAAVHKFELVFDDKFKVDEDLF